jgi:hypothetical protein
MGDDTREGFRQKNKNLVCAATGGPCKIISRSASQTHTGLGIKSSEFNVVAQHLVDTLTENRQTDAFIAIPKGTCSKLSGP